MKLVLWMNQPSHHQSDFFSEIYNINKNFEVKYYGRTPEARKKMGWETSKNLTPYESFCSPEISSLEKIPNWKSAIHIVPGYGSSFLRALIKKLSTEKVTWAHWSEKSHPGLHWLASLPRKIRHAYYVNNHALGALAIGVSAAQDFEHWGIKRQKIAHLPYSINATNENNQDQDILNFRAGRKAFIHVGALCERKGIDILLTAFAKSNHCHHDWCLVLVGNDMSNGKYTSLVESLGINDKVFFRGVISAKSIATAYRAADVFVLASRHDGWGMVVNEAAYIGMPLIVSEAAGSAWHVVDHAVNGFRVTRSSVNSLLMAMDSYIKNPTLIEAHGQMSKLGFKNHSSTVMAQRFVGIINSWLASKN